MSTATVPAAARPGAGSRSTGATLPTLARVELRKMIDTRAGRWVLLVAGLLIVVAAVARALTGAAADQTFGSAFSMTMLPAGVLLPVIGILAASGEWSQRTALTTFALTPRRGRVVAAKALAVLVLGVGGILVGLAAAALGAALASVVGDAPDPWSAGAGELAQGALFQELSVLWGLGFGLLLFSPAAAIVAFFVLPMLFSILGELATGLQSTLEWIDPNVAFSALTEGDAAGGDWPRIAVSAVLWVALPLAAGVVRTLRREVK